MSADAARRLALLEGIGAGPCLECEAARLNYAPLAACTHPPGLTLRDVLQSLNRKEGAPKHGDD